MVEKKNCEICGKEDIASYHISEVKPEVMGSSVPTRQGKFFVCHECNSARIYRNLKAAVKARVEGKTLNDYLAAQKPAPAQEAPAVQIVQPDISEKYPQLKGALLVRLTADANEFSVKGKVGYLKVLEISRYGNVIQGLLYPLTPTGGIDGYGLVVNPKWEAADTRYNEATEKVEVVEATPASPSFTPGELAALSFVLTDCITQYADIMDKDAYQPRGSKALLTAYKKIREVV
jgi:hypothetical protein